MRSLPKGSDQETGVAAAIFIFCSPFIDRDQHIAAPGPGEIPCCPAQNAARRISAGPIFVITIGPYSYSLSRSDAGIATLASICSDTAKPPSCFTSDLFACLKKSKNLRLRCVLGVRVCNNRTNSTGTKVLGSFCRYGQRAGEPDQGFERALNNSPHSKTDRARLTSLRWQRNL